VFDDQNGVSCGTKLPQEIEEASGIPRVKANTGFIQNKQGACKACAQAAGQVDALEFSP
jgi:hypothetical protein